MINRHLFILCGTSLRIHKQVEFVETLCSAVRLYISVVVVLVDERRCLQGQSYLCL